MAESGTINLWITSAIDVWKSFKVTSVCYNGHKATWIICLFVLAILTETVTAVEIDAYHNASDNTKEGDSIELACIITTITSSDTINYVQWKKGGVTYSEFDNVTISDPLNRLSVAEVVQSTLRVYTLTISGVQHQDSGLYSCHVGYTADDNRPSDKSKSVEFSVVYYTPPQSSPSCQVYSDVGNLTIGDLLSLNCTTQLGNPAVNITWIRLSQSGIAKELSLKHINSGTDFAELSYMFNITAEHQGDRFVCSIKSDLFSNFHRNCTIGPIFIVDIPTTLPATTQNATTTYHPTQPPLTQELSATTLSKITTTELATIEADLTSVSVGIHLPTETDTVTTVSTTSGFDIGNTSTSVATTLTTNTISNANMSSNLTQENGSTIPLSSNVTFTSNATGAGNLSATTAPDFTSNVTDTYNSTYQTGSRSQSPTLSTAKPGDPFPNGSGIALIGIIGITAAGIIFCFLICNLCMLTRLFMREKEDKTYTRDLRSRESVQRVNNRIRRGQTNPTIEEETGT